MKLLLTGYCGRSHSIIEKLETDPRVDRIFWAPGNAGKVSSKVQNVPIRATDGAGLVRFTRENAVDLTIVSQNFAIYEGVGNTFRDAKLPVFGPTREMAALEWDKVWAKDFFVKHGISSPTHRLLTDPEEISAYARSVELPTVVKYGGLAYGGGVFLCDTREEVLDAVSQITNSEIRAVSGSDEAVIFEQFVTGREVSMHFMADGEHSVFVGDARDYKRAEDGDSGANTAGMGSYTPTGFVTPEHVRQVQEQIIEPTLAGMQDQGTPYRGVLYAGVIFTDRGPMLLEFNCRFGDSECQALMGRLDANLLDLFLAEDLDGMRVGFKNTSCVTVVMCTAGYPADAGVQEHVVHGLDDVDPDISVYHYGTKRVGGEIVTPTGRVLSVTANGDTREAAAERVYANTGRISWEGVRYRTDVGRLV